MAAILVIEDSEIHRAEIRKAIDASRLFNRVLEAADGICGLKLLISESVDVVLCDLEMPGLDGEKVMRVKNSSPRYANVPFIFLTACTDLDRRARLLHQGACDAIAKPFHHAELVARLGLHLKVKRLQDELMVKNATLARLSTVDALTGLRTRRYVKELLSIEFLRARRYGTRLAVLMADLDLFKEVNDRHGHPAGDAVLQGVAECLLCSLRATDSAGRYGDEELLVVLPQNDEKGGAVVAERWRRSVENTVYMGPERQKISVTISIGVAEFQEAFETPNDLVAAADKALYRAKENGRNCIEVYEG
ncbi:MAG: diguanylate cyclase [Deltaproteobacteria bacterium]|nr:diguanylate cyclase [Deltaproteobacteria bacterium]